MDCCFIAYSVINSLFATQTFFSPLCVCVCVCVCVSLYLVPPPLHPFYLYPQTKHGYLQSNEEEEFLQQVADVLQKTKLEKKKPSPKLQAQDTKPAPPSESDPPKTKVVGSSKPSDISGHQEVKPKAAETKEGDAAWAYFMMWPLPYATSMG